MAVLDVHFTLAASQRDADTSQRLLWPWCRQTGWRLIKATMKEAGISGSRAAQSRQRWLGHARLSTTAIYAAASRPEEAAFVARFWG